MRSHVFIRITLLLTLMVVHGPTLVITELHGRLAEEIMDHTSQSGQSHRAQVDTRSRLLPRSVDASITSAINRNIDSEQSDNFTVEVDTRRRLLRRSVDTSRTAGIEWNDVIDLIFSIAKRDILAQGKDVIPLPDVGRDFKRKYGPFEVTGRLSANQGSLRNITSFRRSADAYVVKEGSIYKMRCVLSFDELVMRYEHYELKVFGLPLKGSLEGTVGSNSISLTLNFQSEDEGCVSTLQEVKLTELEGLKVTVSGLGELNSLGSAIATWMADQSKAGIVVNIERVMASEIEKALMEFQCDEYATLLLL